MAQTKQHGKGAIVSALSRFIHPSEHIRNKFPNPVHGHQLVGCVTLRQEVKKVNRKNQLCIVVCHNDFKNDDDFIKLHAVVKHWKVEVEGGKAHEPKKEHKCQLSSHCTATAQKIQKVKRGV